MTATVRTATARAPRSDASRLVSDAAVMTKRNLLKYRRVPTLLVFSTIQPVMFVLLFVYVFGGAIQVPGTNYTNFLMAGIFVQTSIFGSTQTGVGLADDMTRGLVDRFRSLPMSRSAVLIGRTLSDSVRNLFVVVLMTGVGYVVGFRFQGGVVNAIGALLLAVLFGFAFTWISATIGLSVRDVESAQAATFVWVFPLTFASSAFVPIAGFPGWLQAFSKINPITIAVDAIRALVLGTALTPRLWQALAWIAVLLAIFIPLAVRQYRKAA
jgi:ABC-2 type transport system permease protein/oleandomycin transport system permease protein